MNAEVPVSVSPAKPEFFLFTFPDDVDKVVVEIASDDELCMILSIQDTKVLQNRSPNL